MTSLYSARHKVIILPRNLSFHKGKRQLTHKFIHTKVLTHKHKIYYTRSFINCKDQGQLLTSCISWRETLLTGPVDISFTQRSKQRYKLKSTIPIMTNFLPKITGKTSGNLACSYIPGNVHNFTSNTKRKYSRINNLIT